MSLKIQAFDLDFVEIIMKMGRQEDSNSCCGLHLWAEILQRLMWTHPHNIKQCQVNILKYLGLHIKHKCGS